MPTILGKNARGIIMAQLGMSLSPISTVREVIPFIPGGSICSVLTTDLPNDGVNLLTGSLLFHLQQGRRSGQSLVHPPFASTTKHLPYGSVVWIIISWS